MRSHNKEKELKETDMVIKYYMNGILGEKIIKKISRNLKVYHQYDSSSRNIVYYNFICVSLKRILIERTFSL